MVLAAKWLPLLFLGSVPVAALVVDRGAQAAFLHGDCDCEGAGEADEAPAGPSAIDELADDGRITVVEVYASWCASCQKVEGELSALQEAGDIEFSVKRVAHDDPLAVAELGPLRALPHVVIYGADQQRVKTLRGFVPGALAQTLKEMNQ